MISIIIPSYNHEHYIAEAIQSALDQTLKCEVIVIDDGSTDKTLEIAKSFPVKVIHQVNKGLSSARNTGIMNATGDYILPLDSDDMLYEHAAEKIQEAIDKSGADVIAPSFKCFGTRNGEVILKDMPTLKDFKTANRLGYFSAVKKSALLEIGGYSPRMVWGWEDYHLWMDLFSRGKTLAIIHEPLVMYRTKEESMITEANKHAVELTEQMKRDFPHVYE